MMKARALLTRITDLPYRVAALGTIASMTLTEKAFGASTIGTQLATDSSEFTKFGQFAAGGAFLVGFGLIITGLMKFYKAHESQGRDAKFSEGMWRIVIGGCLMSLLPLVSMVEGSLFGSTSGSSSLAPTAPSSFQVSGS